MSVGEDVFGVQCTVVYDRRLPRRAEAVRPSPRLRRMPPVLDRAALVVDRCGQPDAGRGDRTGRLPRVYDAVR